MRGGDVRDVSREGGELPWTTPPRRVHLHAALTKGVRVWSAPTVQAARCVLFLVWCVTVTRAARQASHPTPRGVHGE